ncbi:GNAT family N-acetyltransferase [Hirschia litorea]|uniref:GNAT family N-acetyltransferase n=1 Tax=Hirschia litorea TaxID=1199156 RepID=A0ABW2IIT7_9PROT
MNIKIISPADLSIEDMQAWRSICASSERYQSPYFSPEFFQIVGAARDDVRLVLAHNEAGEAIGFFPVQVSGVGLPLARPVGAPFADYNGPVLRSGYEHIAADMLAQAGGAVYTFSGIPVLGVDCLSEVEGEEDTYNLVDIQLCDPVLLKTGLNVRGQMPAFIADLSPGFETYLESRRSTFPRHFKNCRRLWRKTEKEAGPLQLTFHEPSIEALETLIGWKQEQYERTGLHNVLSAKWARDMLRGCFEMQTPEFAGVMTTLRCDGKLMAAEFGLRSGSLLHGWISGYNTEYHSYSPGMLLQKSLLEAAANAGILTADMGVGAEHYKKYYASRMVPVCNGVIPATGVKGAMRGIGGEVWHQLERAPLGPVSGFAGKLRRRLDVILSVERSFEGRKQGLKRAFKRV